MIKDVKCEGILIRTADKIVEMGLEGVEEHQFQANEKALSNGLHTNAYMRISESDFKSAKILVDNGLGDAVLLRMGMWRIGKFTYFTKSNKWSINSSKSYYAKSLIDFINKYVGSKK